MLAANGISDPPLPMALPLSQADADRLAGYMEAAKKKAEEEGRTYSTDATDTKDPLPETFVERESPRGDELAAGISQESKEKRPPVLLSSSGKLMPFVSPT